MIGADMGPDVNRATSPVHEARNLKGCLEVAKKEKPLTFPQVRGLDGASSRYSHSIAAASYFGLVFFMDVAKSNPFLATLLSFVTFAVSFLARPFGSLLFGHFGDRLGRKQTLVMALMMMGTATFVVGVLPGYSVLGPLSVVLLCICRACQGLGLAGEWSGAALVATENAPANKRALWGSFPNLGAPLGFFFAYGVNLVLESNLTNDQMVAWGWRIPFLLSAVLVVVGLVVRNRMSETPVFQKAVKEDHVAKSPLKELRKYWKQVVLGTCAMGITYTLFYLLGTWRSEERRVGKEC